MDWITKKGVVFSLIFFSLIFANLSGANSSFLSSDQPRGFVGIEVIDADSGQSLAPPYHLKIWVYFDKHPQFNYSYEEEIDQNRFLLRLPADPKRGGRARIRVTRDYYHDSTEFEVTSAEIEVAQRSARVVHYKDHMFKVFKVRLKKISFESPMLYTW